METTETRAKKKYVVATPMRDSGTFSDRMLMEAIRMLIGGMTIAGVAVGAAGLIYVRSEYPYAEATLIGR